MTGKAIQEEDALLSFDGVEAWYSRSDPVIKAGGMAVPLESVVGLVGKNGAGKTTLVRSLCGVHQQVAFKGLALRGKPCSQKDESFKRSRYACFAYDKSFRYWTLEKLVTFIERCFSSERDDSYLKTLLEGFGLTDLYDTRLDKLSDGQRKKAALCSAFYARRPLLFLDEPVDFLDFSSTEFLYTAVRSYADAYGSILLCSHIAESFTRCCTSLYSLEDGVIDGPFEVPEKAEDLVRVLESAKGR